MRFSMRPAATALTLVLATGALASPAPAPRPAHLLAAQAQESSRIQQAKDFLRARAPQLGLTGLDDFQVVSVLTNPQGEAVVRFSQRHQGSPVLGTTVVVRVGKQLHVTAKHLEDGIQLPSGQPRLSADQAVEVAHRDLTPTGVYSEQPSVERIVFPTRMVGGIEPRLDPTSGIVVPDPLRSVSVGAVKGRHVWAYHVTRKLVSSAGLPLVLHAIVDGSSGLILRKWSEGQSEDPIASGVVQPPAVDYDAQAARLSVPIRVASAGPQVSGLAPSSSAVPAPDTLTPAVGLAKTQFAGDVEIPTSFDSVANGYGLHDLQRGLGSSPFLDTRRLPAGNRIISEAYDWARQEWLPDGTIITHYYDYTMASGPYGQDEVTGSVDNVWGNNQDNVMLGWGQSPFTDTAKTAAAEAMHAVTTVWDVLNNVFNRKSYDGNDTSIVVQANVNYMNGKTMWSPDQGLFISGMGSTDGWGDTSGSISTRNGAELTNIARELGIALHQSVIPYTPEMSLERQHLERSTGALLSQLAEAYAQRQPTDPADTIPAAPVDWMFGRTRYDDRPFFWMIKPSKDGFSADAYFDGIWMLGQQYFDGFSYGDGPMNRAWYFMAEGASSDSSSDAYSPFLPQGMAGIGLHKVGQILFKALTERYLDTSGYDEARVACIAAAEELFGAGSPEVVAVTNAFAAVNVGAPFGGSAPVRVSFPDHLVEDGTPAAPNFVIQHFQFVPTGEWVKLKAQVQNAANPAVTWKATGVPGLMTSAGGATQSQGTFRADGAYRAPAKGNTTWSVQAWSAEDPRQFAQSVVWAFDLDSNGDSELDALDMADIAMLAYLPSPFKDALNPNALYGKRTSISDWDIQMVTLAFNNAFNN